MGPGPVDKLNSASGPSKASIAAHMAVGFASSFVPGLGVASSAAQAAQARSQAAEAAKNQAQMTERTQEMMKVLPQLMRGQRLVELGQARKCDWTQPPQAR
jgi:hypothetical protein